MNLSAMILKWHSIKMSPCYKRNPSEVKMTHQELQDLFSHSWKVELQRERERSSISWGYSWNVCNVRLHLGLLCWWWGPKPLSHPLLASRESNSRKLHRKQRWRWSPWHLDRILSSVPQPPPQLWQSHQSRHTHSTRSPLPDNTNMFSCVPNHTGCLHLPLSFSLTTLGKSTAPLPFPTGPAISPGMRPALRVQVYLAESGALRLTGLGKQPQRSCWETCCPSCLPNFNFYTRE